MWILNYKGIIALLFYGPRNVQDFSFNMLTLVYMVTHYKNVINIQAVLNKYFL